MTYGTAGFLSRPSWGGRTAVLRVVYGQPLHQVAPGIIQVLCLTSEFAKGQADKWSLEWYLPELVRLKVQRQPDQFRGQARGIHISQSMNQLPLKQNRGSRRLAYASRFWPMHLDCPLSNIDLSRSKAIWPFHMMFYMCMYFFTMLLKSVLFIIIIHLKCMVPVT